MASILKQLTMVRFTVLLFVLIFVVLLVVGTINFYAVYDVLFRFREMMLASVVALSVSLIIFPFISIPAVESIVERAEKLNIKVESGLVRDYVDGCFTAFLLSAIEMVLIIAIQLVEGVTLITLATFALLLTLIIVFFIVVYSLWVVTRLLQEVAKS